MVPAFLRHGCPHSNDRGVGIPGQSAVGQVMGGNGCDLRRPEGVTSTFRPIEISGYMWPRVQGTCTANSAPTQGRSPRRDTACGSQGGFLVDSASGDTVDVHNRCFLLGMVNVLLSNRVPAVQTAHPTEPLDDERIAQALTDGFSPHRVTVEFQNERLKVAFRVRGPNGAEFVVEGKRLDLLRDPGALAQYIQDVRIH